MIKTRKIVKIEDIEVPKLKPDEVLIKVEAASYNYNDLWAIWGQPIKIPMPHISGTDISGTVVELGQQVTSLAKGDGWYSRQPKFEIVVIVHQVENMIVKKD